ncbi:MAG: hypothetical protein FD167_5195 [bacterium]|nr:MAG: hypothetical protein FD167_5195 [bacterium]
MKLIRLLALIFLFFGYLLFLLPNTFAQEFKYQVEEERLLKDRGGELIISIDQIEFRAKEEKNSLKWNYHEIELVQLDSPTEIKIWSYHDQAWILGRDKRFTFKVTAPLLDKYLIDFLRSRLERPFVISFSEDKQETSIAEIAVKHFHRMGGCQGILKIYSDHLDFTTSSGQDSRSWLWKEIKSINRSGEWELEVLTYENMVGGSKRSYHFALKTPLAEQVYEQIWQKIYPSTALAK